MQCVWEHNGNDTLLYSVQQIGAYTRGHTLEEAISKMQSEAETYSLWCGEKTCQDTAVEIIQEKNSDLQIADADSDVLFESEVTPLMLEEYEVLKELTLRSARDFYALYCSVPNKAESCLPHRKTFYGNVPRTAQEMYDHTKNVNAYYFGEIDVEADNDGTIYDCRSRAFARLEQIPGFLNNKVVVGSYGEPWTLRKVMRRFIWHDRIHAKAMYRMAVKTFGNLGVQNVFQFKI